MKQYGAYAVFIEDIDSLNFFEKKIVAGADIRVTDICYNEDDTLVQETKKAMQEQIDLIPNRVGEVTWIWNPPHEKVDTPHIAILGWKGNFETQEAAKCHE